MATKTSSKTKDPFGKKKKPTKPTGHIKTLKTLLSSKNITKTATQSLKEFMAALKSSDPKTHAVFEAEHKEYLNREVRENFAADELFHVVNE